MQVLVTGGGGFIGSSVVDQLIGEGARVRVLDNFWPQVHPDGVPEYLNPAADLIQADVRGRADLAHAVADADAVIHCAAAVGVAQSQYRVEEYVDINVRATGLLLELLADQRHRHPRLIVFTSMTGYGEGQYRRPSDGTLLRVGIRNEADVRQFGWEPVCPVTHEPLEPVGTTEDAELKARNVYALTKRHQEDLALALGEYYDFPVVCLRLFNVYGPRQSLSNPYTGVLAIFLSRLLAGQPPLVYEDGRQTRDFVSVHDVVSAAILALHSRAAVGHTYNIGTGVSRAVIDCATELAALLGRPDLVPCVTGEFRRGDVRHCVADITRAKRDLGFEPRIGWREGLAELVGWSRGAAASDRTEQANRELRERGIIRG